MTYIETRWSAQRIRALRQRLGLSQAALGDQLGVSNITVNRWENGHKRPSPLAERALDTAGVTLKEAA